MTYPAFQIFPFDKNATPDEYTALNRHFNRIRLEQLPDDPPIPVDETVQNLRSLPDFVDLRLWAAWEAGNQEIIGQGNVVILRREENQHLAQFEISVLPEYRRQGLGRQLLSLIADAAEREGRRLILTRTVDRTPGGEAFMLRLGATKGMEGHTNQLRMDDLDRELVNRWLARGQENLAEFELGFWDGAYPQDQLQAIAELYDLTNQQPHGELEIEDMHMTPEQLRQMEQNIFARGNQRWTFYLLHRQTGKFAGYTETVWNPNRPEILRQEMTGVFPHYRKKGLGSWLKAAMLDKVLKERPQVKVVRTGNSDANVAILKINTALGFKPYTADSLWQVEIAKVQDYLQASNKDRRDRHA